MSSIDGEETILMLRMGHKIMICHCQLNLGHMKLVVQYIIIFYLCTILVYSLFPFIHMNFVDNSHLLPDTTGINSYHILQDIN